MVVSFWVLVFFWTMSLRPLFCPLYSLYFLFLPLRLSQITYWIGFCFFCEFFIQGMQLKRFEMLKIKIEKSLFFVSVLKLEVKFWSDAKKSYWTLLHKIFNAFLYITRCQSKTMGSINTLTYLLFLVWFFKTLFWTDLWQNGKSFWLILNSLKNSTLAHFYKRVF